MGDSPRQAVHESGGLKWFPFISAMFVTALIVSNIIAVKLVTLGGLYLPAAAILFPIAFYRSSRGIWAGFLYITGDNNES